MSINGLVESEVVRIVVAELVEGQAVRDGGL